MVNWRMACSSSWQSGAKGGAGNRLFRAPIKSRAARWESLAEEVWGMVQFWGGVDGLGNAFGGSGQYLDVVKLARK